MSDLSPPGSSRLARPGAPTGSVRFDDDRPGISVYIMQGELTAGDVDRMLAHGEELLRRGRHAVLMDLRRLQAMPALERRKVAEWNKANAARLTRHRVGLALVMTDGRERGIITAIYWHNPPANPYMICANIGEALAWCETRLAG